MNQVVPGQHDSPDDLQLLETIGSLRTAVDRARRAGKSIALVPTMGALHQGHLSLVDAARAECDVVVVTIFVNPTQFGAGEDLEQYPRTLESDLAQLRDRHVTYAFAPHTGVIYPKRFSTFVEPPEVSRPLEGRCRPGHFRGVATVVLKLFHLVPADVALFGEKDYQQSLVIRRMVEDLNLPITIRSCPTVREADGLATSSRNRYLNPVQRSRARALWLALCRAREMVEQGERQTSVLCEQMRRVLCEAQITRVDYAAIADPETLDPVPRVDRPARALVAAYVDDIRLIDNCSLGRHGKQG